MTAPSESRPEFRDRPPGPAPATSGSPGSGPEFRPGIPARWPLLLLALPAMVAIWSGWVGLGEKAGFGPVALLPGILDYKINTAITLPIGMETYAAYALRAWLGRGTPEAARVFARRSALTALALGAAGQVAYHLMVAAEWETAPWPVVVVVSCVPVAVLGMGAALAHLLREPPPAPPAEPQPTREPLVVDDTPPAPMGREAAVYRLRDDKGSLLYVGCSVEPLARLKAHRARAPWGDAIASQDITWYPSIDEAASAEQDAIATEQPRHNVGTARYGWDSRWYWLAKERAAAAAAEPPVEPEPAPEPPAPPPSPEPHDVSQGEPGGWPRLCGCGCGAMVSRATDKRHRAQQRKEAEEAAELASRAQSNGHRDLVGSS